MNDITLRQARGAVSTAIEKSNEIGVKMNIAIVDRGANLKAFARMDEACDLRLKRCPTSRGELS